MKRDHLDLFLNQIQGVYDLAVWTSSSANYAQSICSQVFDGIALKFVFDRTHCTPKRSMQTDEVVYTKSFKKVLKFGYGKEEILVIDDDPEKYASCFGNLIQVSKFFGEPDDELLKLIRYLIAIQASPDYRAIDKRSWRSMSCRDQPF